MNGGSHESNQIGILVACDHVLIGDNANFESSTNTDTHIQLGISSGAVAGATEIGPVTLSAGYVDGFKLLDAVNYTDARIERSHFIDLEGVNVYLGATEGNRPSFFKNNFIADPRTHVQVSASQGKWTFADNDEGAVIQRITLADGDTTPNVLNIKNCVTANTSATAVTKFDNISAGQILAIRVNDSNTSFVNGTSILTQSGEDLSPASGDTIVFLGIAGSNQGTSTAAIEITSELGFREVLTWDPGSIADGAGETSSAISVPGAAFSDFVMVAAPYDLQGVMAMGYVSSAGNVKIRLQNGTGSALNLANGTWVVKVIKTHR